MTLTLSAGQKAAFITEDIIPLLSEIKNHKQIQNILVEYINYLHNDESNENN